MKRFVLRAGKDIENRFVDDLTVQELAKFDFEIETNQVYQLNIVVATGDGRVKTAEFKPTVFQRDVNQSYQLKLDAARKAFNEINKNYTVFPFPARYVFFLLQRPFFFSELICILVHCQAICGSVCHHLKAMA